MDIFSSVHKFALTVSTWEISEWIFNTITTQRELSERNSLLQCKVEKNLTQSFSTCFVNQGCVKKKKRTTGTNFGSVFSLKC